MRFLKLTIAYDGTDYCGWQVQAKDASIQQRLEQGWKKVTGESIRITASGRTDGGVHAEAQVCSLMTATDLTHQSLVRALNAETPNDIAILSVEDAPMGFHAIRDAIGKTYRYQIQYGRIRDPLRRRFWWHFPHELNIEAMRTGANHLLGTHDFASFQSAGAERSSTIRTVTQLELIHRDPRARFCSDRCPSPVLTNSAGLQQSFHDRDRDRDLNQDPFPTLVILISADGFLYKMVRNIVGALVRVGQERESPDWIAEVLAQRNRNAAGQSAPANGLFLQEVRY